MFLFSNFVVASTNSYTKQSNTTYTGTQINTYFVNTTSDCQSLCNGDYTCSGVIWSNNRNGQCTLNSFFTGAVTGSKSDTYIKTYIPNSNVMSSGFDYFGYDIDVFYLDTISLCYQACDLDASCELSIYDMLNKRCNLKYSIGVPFQNSFLNLYFKPMNSDLGFTTIYDSTYSINSNIISVVPVQNRSECETACNNSANCQAAVFGIKGLPWYIVSSLQMFIQISVSGSYISTTSKSLLLNFVSLCATAVDSNEIPENNWIIRGSQNVVSSVAGLSLCVTNTDPNIFCNDNWQAGDSFYQLIGYASTLSLSGNRICVINSSFELYCSNTPVTSWNGKSGTWYEIAIDNSVGQHGCAIDTSNRVYCTTSTSGTIAWTDVTVVPMIKISLFGNVMCGIDMNNDAYCATFMNKDWKQLQMKAISVAVNDTTVFVVTPSNNIYRNSLSMLNNVPLYVPNQYNQSILKNCTLRSNYAASNIINATGTNIFVKSPRVTTLTQFKSTTTTIAKSSLTTKASGSTTASISSSITTLQTVEFSSSSISKTLSGFSQISSQQSVCLASYVTVTNTQTQTLTQTNTVTNTVTKYVSLFTTLDSLHQSNLITTSSNVDITTKLNSLESPSKAQQIMQAPGTLSLINQVFKVLISASIALIVLKITPIKRTLRQRSQNNTIQ